MNRRAFLKAGGLFATALFVPTGPRVALQPSPREGEAQAVLYRAAPGGKIHASHDAGKSWQAHANFGPVSVLSVGKDAGGVVRAQLEYAGHGFTLTLAEDGVRWMTM